MPPLGSSRRSAARTASRSVVGALSARGRWLNAIAPTRMLRGTCSEEVLRRVAGRDEPDGCTSVACIEPEMSVTSMIDARSSGTACVACGRASATTSAASASAYAAIGTCRRQPGRLRTTEGCTGASANASAARARPRAWAMYAQITSGTSTSPARKRGAWKLTASRWLRRGPVAERHLERALLRRCAGPSS